MALAWRFSKIRVKQPMEWSNRGRVFDPAILPESLSIGLYAQSPQAVDMGDRVRVFFSTRTLDDNQKFRSQVAWVDMSRDFDEVLEVADSPVMNLGEMGTFDEHGIFPFSPCRVGDSVYAYTTGWSRRKSVSVETAIGLAVSEDGGFTFERVGAGPIMSANVTEPFLVGDAFVMHMEGRFLMWYIFGDEWTRYGQEQEPDRIYRISQATSSDGLTWERGQGYVIPTVLTEDECQALPTVAHFGRQYHMVFCYRYASDFRTNSRRGYQLGYATSTDLTSWSRDDQGLVLSQSHDGFDSEMRCYPHLTLVDGRHFLLFNGNAFGRAGFGVAELMN